MKLIGITGKARSGKDTIATHLFEQYGFTRIALADPLKEAAQTIFGLSTGQTWDDAHKGTVIPYWGKSPRELFQILGTESIRDVFGHDVWTKRWALSYEMFKDTDDVVVPDIRFDNEAQMIRDRGGIIIEVQRGPGLVGSTGSHPSERGLSSLPDYVINNESSLDDLKAKVDLVLGDCHGHS